MYLGNCESAPPLRQHLDTERSLNGAAGPAGPACVLNRAEPDQAELVLPASGAAERDSGERSGSYGSSPGARGAGLPPVGGVRAADWPTAIVRHFPLRQRCL